MSVGPAVFVSVGPSVLVLVGPVPVGAVPVGVIPESVLDGRSVGAVAVSVIAGGVMMVCDCVFNTSLVKESISPPEVLVSLADGAVDGPLTPSVADAWVSGGGVMTVGLVAVGWSLVAESCVGCVTDGLSVAVAVSGKRVFVKEFTSLAMVDIMFELSVLLGAV